MRKLFALGAAWMLLWAGPAPASVDAHKEGSSSGPVPGINGTTGNEDTLAYLMNLQNANLPAYLPRIYFSADTTAGCPGDIPQGNDVTGDGTKVAPFRSLAKFLAVSRQGGVVGVFDACDTWETNSAGAAGDDECDACAAPGPYALDANETMQWTFNTGLTRCTLPEKDTICVAMIGSDPSGLRRPTFSPAMFDGATTGNFIQIQDTASHLLSDIRGWFYFENLIWGTAAAPFPAAACNTQGDFFRMDAPSKVAVLNNTFFICGDNNEIWTSHNTNVGEVSTSYFVSINTDCNIPQWAADENAVCYFSIGNGSIVLLGGTSRLAKAFGAAARTVSDVKMTPAVAAQPLYGFVYGHRTRFTAAADGNTRFGYLSSVFNGATDVARLFVARSFVEGAVSTVAEAGGFWGVPDMSFAFGANAQLTYAGFGNSSWNNKAFVSGGPIGVNDADRWLWQEYCSAHAAGTAGVDRIIGITAGGGSMDNVDFDWRKVFVNESNPHVAQFGGVTRATIALACANVQTDLGRATPITSCDLTDETSDPFGTTLGPAGLTGTAQVQNGCNLAVFEKFQTGIYIPAFLSGAPDILNGFLIGRVPGRIGR